MSGTSSGANSPGTEIEAGASEIEQGVADEWTKVLQHGSGPFAGIITWAKAELAALETRIKALEGGTAGASPSPAAPKSPPAPSPPASPASPSAPSVGGSVTQPNMPPAPNLGGSKDSFTHTDTHTDSTTTKD